LGRERGVLVMEDLGSGALVDLSPYGLPPEPTVGVSIKHGADIVAYSGDKLLGGPQCGILLGKNDFIGQMAAHPLFRALRADKMTLAALEATLRLYENEETLREIPTLRMLLQTPEELTRRARRLRAVLAKVPGVTAVVRDGVGYSGGGTLPEAALPTKLVAVSCPPLTDESLAEALRHHQPPIIGRRDHGQFVMDVRTLRDDEVPLVAGAFRDITANVERS
jgi:L-seryl-tRNA(Ser) seleniumtransferase